MNEHTAGLVCFYNGRGEIIINGYMTEAEANINASHYDLAYCMADADYRKHYVEDGRILDRPKMVLEVSGSTIRGIPINAEILIEDTCYVADGTDIHLTFSGTQQYLVSIKMWPYQDEELNLEN